MNNDLRNLMYNADEPHIELKEGHEVRFLNKLDQLDIKKTDRTPINMFRWWAVAAGLIILVSASMMIVIKENPIKDDTLAINETKSEVPITLGDLSPKLQQVQDLYLTSISLELAEIEITDENETLVTSYLSQLKRLDEAYDDLTIELNQLGPNNNTINSLIQNLELQLKLLKELRNEINQIKSTHYDQA